MIINGYPCAYQDYEKRIIVFSNASRSHFIIQDIYAEFFRLCILQNNSKEFVIHKISQEYGVAESVVSQDFDCFTASLTRACSPSVPCSNPASAQLVVKDSDIYSLMSQDLVPFSATIEITLNVSIVIVDIHFTLIGQLPLLNKLFCSCVNSGPCT